MNNENFRNVDSLDEMTTEWVLEWALWQPKYEKDLRVFGRKRNSIRM